jgi:hypothetical protein
MSTASSQTKSDEQRNDEDKEGLEQPIQTLDEERGRQIEEDQTLAKMSPREEVEQEQQLETFPPVRDYEDLIRYTCYSRAWTPEESGQREEQRRKLEKRLWQKRQEVKEVQVQAKVKASNEDIVFLGQATDSVASSSTTLNTLDGSTTVPAHRRFRFKFFKGSSTSKRPTETDSFPLEAPGIYPPAPSRRRITQTHSSSDQQHPLATEGPDN